MKERIKIALAEDHPLVRHGLTSLLKHYKTVQIVFEAVSGGELFEKLKSITPDLLLLDLKMPGMEASEVLQRICEKHKNLKVIVISSFYEEEYIIECFKYGVKAFLAKGDKIEKMIEAIFSVHKHGIYSDLAITKILASQVSISKKNRNSQAVILSRSEIGVLKLVTKGVARRDVAEQLGVKIETVNFHMNNMIRKTKSYNAPALIAYAIKHKIIKP